VTRNATLLGLAGLIVAGLGWVLDPKGFYGGWLAALTLFAAWPLGSMAILMIHALTGGRWGEVLQPALRLGVCSLPLLLPAALPLVPGLAPLYPWARPDAAHQFGNLFYLNPPFFAGRGVFYLVVWFVLGWLVLRPRGLAPIAPVGLFLLALTTTFAAIDTTMSLDPHFTSSIYGMVAAAGMGLLALSVAVLLTAGEVAADVRADLGKLLLALVVLWIYLDFIQLLIVWQSNLVTEAPWYVQRARGLWGAVWLLTTIGHFVLPFFLLLSPRMQQSRRVVMFVAGLLVAMEVLRSWWTVLPSMNSGVDWIAIACMVGIGGVALAFARWAGRRAPAMEAAHV
jgi:hypothetical protein